jgi:hypothetical protein
MPVRLLCLVIVRLSSWLVLLDRLSAGTRNGWCYGTTSPCCAGLIRSPLD